MSREITRSQLIDLLNEDLAREYQAIVAYVIYSQVLKGAEYMSIAAELEKHASEELAHALTVSKHIDYLGGMPTTKVLPVKQLWAGIPYTSLIALFVLQTVVAHDRDSFRVS